MYFKLSLFSVASEDKLKNVKVQISQKLENLFWITVSETSIHVWLAPLLQAYDEATSR